MHYLVSGSRGRSYATAFNVCSHKGNLRLDTEYNATLHVDLHVELKLTS